MSESLFPEVEDKGCGPFREIANRLGCYEDAVWDAFRGLGVPEWEAPKHLDAVKRTTQALNEAARHAQNLHSAIWRLSKSQREDLLQAGAVTLPQIEHLRAVLAGDAGNLEEWGRNRDRRGGRNPAAYVVAEGMRRLYRRLRRRITFGQHPDSGPSTDFGRDVDFAIGQFGVRADWRGPARAAWEKQARIEARLDRCLHARALREGRENSPGPLDMSGISISFEGMGKDRVVLISVDGRSDVPPLRLRYSLFSSGKEIEETAVEWAATLRGIIP